MVAENCSGGGEGAAVDSEEMNEEKNVKKFGGGTPFPGYQCGAETPRSLVELRLLSH